MFNRILYTVLSRAQKDLGKLGTQVRFNYLLFAGVLLLSAASFWLSYEMRFDFSVPGPWRIQRWLVLPYATFLKVAVFYVLRGHSVSWRYVGIRDIPTLLLHCAICALTFFLMPLFTSTVVVPRGVILIDFLMSVFLIGGMRGGLRYIREKIMVFLLEGQHITERPALVIGAGDAGEMIIREIGRNPRSGFRVRAIFDDDKSKQGLHIHGVRVLGGIEQIPIYVEEQPTALAIVAVPSADSSQINRIYKILKSVDLPVKILPPLDEILEGLPKLTQLREISIADLLGRAEVNIDSEQVQRLIDGRIVLITGAGGSIGSELCRQIFKRNPSLMILMDRAENSLFHIHRQLELRGGRGRVVPLLCDITDQARVDYEFSRFKPELVFHAAAYKHVPMQEFNPVECFKNNIGGTRTMVVASDKFGVSRFLMISTDKAVRPAGVMGATKRACEIYCQAFASISQTKFLSVRFGNVLGSEGSVVPIFLEQIARGGPITITHPDMQRYFMTIPEAVTLVLQATALGESGQIMVLEMGDPIKIVDLARQLIMLSANDENEIPIEFVGLRPGEKLMEELHGSTELYSQTAHNKILVFNPNSWPPNGALDRIDSAIELMQPNIDDAQVRQILHEIVPEYQSDFDATPLMKQRA